jgi:hypothetical protein
VALRGRRWRGLGSHLHVIRWKEAFIFGAFDDMAEPPPILIGLFD